MDSAIELLAPAKDAAVAAAAIRCGADAVYLGAPQFSARQAAGNTIDDIRRVIDLAHPYHVRVYAALNTLLFDRELADAEWMIRDLHAAGIDGLILQDLGLLELDLPSLPLIASTQVDNATPEKVRFLESVGFSRVILAREQSLEQIRDIRRATSIELECFIHGALCVCASGKCTLSYALGGRSGNRGQCAQPCRKSYSLRDGTGKTLVQDRFLLSIRDLNLSDHLEELIDAGVTSFKIEGRLKDAAYVANIVGYYRHKLDAILSARGLRKSSSGRVHLNFTPDPAKTFNRGFTDYALSGGSHAFGSIDTPKSIGEFLGKVARVEKGAFALDTSAELHNGDGLCFFDEHNNLAGTVVNGVEGRLIRPRQITGIRPGMAIYRNYDHAFTRQLESDPARRTIPVTLRLSDTPDGLALTIRDEDGNHATVEHKADKSPAQKPDSARERLAEQLQKLGNTIFESSGVSIDCDPVPFLPVSAVNQLRRSAVEALLAIREQNRSTLPCRISSADSACPYPEKHLSYRDHVLNEKARSFFLRHGVETIEPTAESGLDMTGRIVMTTKYCLRQQLGLCGGPGQTSSAEPLLLIDEDGNQLRLEFRCGDCGMNIFLTKSERNPT
jgi:23S rRNA 5-hydroxycytidine C2501 synthase